MAYSCELTDCSRLHHSPRWCVDRDMTCEIDGCSKTRRSGKWCPMHYERSRVHGDPMHQTWTKVCTVKGCEKPHKSGGYCEMHWSRFVRTGSARPDAPPRASYLPGAACAVDGCSRSRQKLNYCGACYRRLCMDGASRTSAARRRARQRDAICEHGTDCVSVSFIRGLLASECLYCGAPAAHADHFVPLIKGGLHCSENLVPACAPCNLSKHARDPWEWWASFAEMSATA